MTGLHNVLNGYFASKIGLLGLNQGFEGRPRINRGSMRPIAHTYKSPSKLVNILARKLLSRDRDFEPLDKLESKANCWKLKRLH